MCCVFAGATCRENAPTRGAAGPSGPGGHASRSPLPLSWPCWDPSSCPGGGLDPDPDPDRHTGGGLDPDRHTGGGLDHDTDRHTGGGLDPETDRHTGGGLDPDTDQHTDVSLE